MILSMGNITSLIRWKHLCLDNSTVNKLHRWSATQFTLALIQVSSSLRFPLERLYCSHNYTRDKSAYEALTSACDTGVGNNDVIVHNIQHAYLCRSPTLNRTSLFQSRPKIELEVLLNFWISSVNRLILVTNKNCIYL